MRWKTLPGWALLVALMIAMVPGFAAAQADGTPAASPQTPEQAVVWEELDGVQQAVMRTWGDIPEGTPAPGEIPALRFVTGLVVQFDGEEQAAAGLGPIRDWMVASLQVNLVDVTVEVREADVASLGDSSSAVTATGTAGDLPLSIAVVIVQDGDRILAVGGSIMAEENLLSLSEGVVREMLNREPGGEETQDNVGRFSGGLWDIFPEQDAVVLDGMRRQGDLPIYQVGTPES